VDDPDAVTFEEAFFGIDTSCLAKEDDNQTEQGPAEELNRYPAVSRKTTTVNACFSLEIVCTFFW